MIIRRTIFFEGEVGSDERDRCRPILQSNIEDKKELEDVESFVIEESSFAYYTKCHLPPTQDRGENSRVFI